MTRISLASLALLMAGMVSGQSSPDTSKMVIKGLAIKAPSPAGVSPFVDFIHKVLGPTGINTLILRVDHDYAYTSRPELRSDDPLTATMVAEIRTACEKHGIRIVPQINLLGHQSWHSNASKLLEVYPEFDETPDISLPKTYHWPNEDSLYCKSYCPLHPDVHDVVFDLVDELLTAFGAHDFHAGMDEVFYLGHEQCPRCAGKNRAALYANEVTLIRNHLEKKGCKLWIWGDRLIDGKTTGIGMWEASNNGTHPAIDSIPKDVMICDWHYDRAEPTAAYFALKGFEVITCPWNKASVALDQIRDFHAFQQSSNSTLRSRYLGMMQTVWTSAEQFMEAFDHPEAAAENLRNQVECFKTVLSMETQ
ncbi:MAG: family 20 glycosylhydrolase [Saprospiraceae bacterium]|nr:family 20 glycosylhydrolase [Saprospiraceae bacterium]